MKPFDQFQTAVENNLQKQMRVLWATAPYSTHLFDDQPNNHRYILRHQMETLTMYRLTRELNTFVNDVLITRYNQNTQIWSDYLLATQAKEHMLMRYLKIHQPSSNAPLFQTSIALVETLHETTTQHNVLPAICYALLTQWQAQLQQKITQTPEKNHTSELFNLTFQLDKNQMTNQWINLFFDYQKKYFESLYHDICIQHGFIPNSPTTTYSTISTAIH